MTATARPHARSFALALVVALVFGLFTAAHAQSFDAFAGPVLQGLLAAEIDCAELGLSSGDRNRCGRIPDNLVASNRAVVTRHVNNWGLTVSYPWKVEVLEGYLNHQLGVFGNGWTYVINYLEIDDSMSLVWIAGNRR